MSCLHSQTQHNKYDSCLNLVRKQLSWFQKFLMEKPERAFGEGQVPDAVIASVVTELQLS